MRLAPIRLRSYFLTELHLQARSGFDPNAASGWKQESFLAEQKLGLVESPKNNERVWKIDLSIQHQPTAEDNFPYSFRLKLVGFIEEAPELEKLDAAARERMVRINGSSILYGAAREIVRAATGRGPHAPVLLPTVSFWDPAPSPKSEAVATKAEQPPESGEHLRPKKPRRPARQTVSKSGT